MNVLLDSLLANVMKTTKMEDLVLIVPLVCIAKMSTVSGFNYTEKSHIRNCIGQYRGVPVIFSRVIAQDCVYCMKQDDAINITKQEVYNER